jgi:hypothetical protein
VRSRDKSETLGGGTTEASALAGGRDATRTSSRAERGLVGLKISD